MKDRYSRTDLRLGHRKKPETRPAHRDDHPVSPAELEFLIQGESATPVPARDKTHTDRSRNAPS